MRRKSSPNILLLVSWIVLGLVAENNCQVKRPADRTPQETSPGPKEDLSNWQTVVLNGKGIKLKLPRDWHYEGEDLADTKNEYFTLEQMQWASTDTGLMLVHITTPAKGLVSSEGKDISKEQAVQEKFESETQSEKETEKGSTKGGATFTDVKKLKISGVEGVFERVHIDFKDKSTGQRSGIIWTGYRRYRGKAQEIDINISAQPKDEGVLQTILNTLEIEQDKDPESRVRILPAKP
jgi:hypothetical protein